MSIAREKFDSRLEFLARIRSLVMMDAVFDASTQAGEMKISVYKENQK